MKKRFIAGAVCPACGLMDKIVNYQDAEKNYRECVSCGFKDEIHIQPHLRELDTRVNQSETQKASETQVLQFPPKDP
ncbi:YheV family putative zinc ribbon protein [Teredinibacter turnerae]|uniref:YheV family putative zinc ribbon protein n=1 Tax=Teredinibacter turnerae TaxID=2426 RepID=UPI000369D10E|nr:YheV family putative zinc ribbon protein [Teredinibacter turnerae]